MKKIKTFAIIILCFLTILPSFTSCAEKQTAREIYCNKINTQDKGIKDIDLSNQKKSDQKAVTEFYSQIKAIAPENMVDSWNTLIKYIPAMVDAQNSQTLDNLEKQRNEFVNAYKKILKDYNNYCL